MKRLGNNNPLTVYQLQRNIRENSLLTPCERTKALERKREIPYDVEQGISVGELVVDTVRL